MFPLTTPSRSQTPSRLLLSLFVWAGVLQFTQTVQAQTSWAAAASGNWNTAASWSPASVPGVGTAATIAVAGTYAVTYDSPMSAASIASLALGSSTVTLNLSAAGFNVAGTTTFVDSLAETININSGGVMNNGTLAMSSQAGLMNVNSGGFLTNATTKVADNSNNDGSTRLKINSGAVASLGTVTVGRNVANNITYGLYISGGTVSASSIDVGSRNSYANMTVAGGTLTNAGSLRLGTGASATGRERTYYQSAGTVSCAGTMDMTCTAAASGTAESWFSLTGSGAVFAASGIRIFPNSGSSLVARFTNSGTIYLGSAGFKVLNSGTYSVALNDQSVLGANADWAANVTMVAPSGTITFKAADAGGTGHDIILTNVISGGASLAKTGNGSLTLLGANTYTGNTTVGAGTLALGNNSALPKTTTLTIGGSGTAGIFDLAGFNPQISGLATAGTAANQLITNSSAANTATLTFSNSAANSTFGGVIAGGSKPVALTVLGGNLTLSGQNNYAGNIFLSNGKLALSAAGSIFTGSQIVLSNATATLDVSGMGGISLSAGQSVSGYGVVTGSVTAANCSLAPGINGGGALTFTNNLTLTGNVTNQFDLLLDPGAAGSDQIAVGGALNASGVNIIKINPLAGSLLEGTYHLIVCGAVASGDTNNFQLTGSPGAGLLAALNMTATGLDLVITLAGGAERVWVGDGAANPWDFVTTNWLRAGLPDLFANGNSTIFDNSSTNRVVTLVGALHPLSVTVDSTNGYTFAGAGKITGVISLEKTNSGALIILTTNDYVGVMTIDQGTLQVGNGVASGALGSGALENNGVLLMQQPSGSTLSNVIGGTGVLIQSGTATLTLAASNTFSGGTLISSGTLQIGNGGTPGSGGVTNNSALVFNNSANNTLSAAISGTGTVALAGAGTVTFTGMNTYTGGTTVGAGTLLLNGTNGSGTVTVNSGGTLSGKGKIGGSVILNSGGILSPGSTVGTLTVVSNLTANAGAVLNFAVGTTSDKVVVGGDLNLSGTLNLTDSGGLGNGTYTLFTYGGGLVLNGGTFGTVPSGKLYELDTTTAGQVNLIVGVIATNVPAFPGALGFGSIVTGGRGKPAYHVTTLADSGTGSFRDAVSVSGRTIVFDVGGYITLNSAVSAKGNLTIAGQTAPGGGIGFKGGEISFAGQANVICRFIRVRPGSETASSTDDALSLYQAKNVILDHCSFEFAPWNNIDGVGDSTHVITNITFQNCLIADPTGQQFGAHTESVGGTWSWFYNIFANSHNRNPLAKANTVFINNINYNYSAAYTTHTGTPFKHDLVNNYFICGPASSGGGNTWFQIDNNQSMYFTGNLRDTSLDGVMNGSTTVPLPGYQGGGTILSAPWSTWVTNSSVTIYTPQTAYRLTASRAGTLPRDEMDSLIVNQVKTLGSGTTGTGAGTAGPSGSLYTSQTQTGLGNNGYGTIIGGPAPLDSDGDGMPDYWESATGLNLINANDATNLTLSGYTQLEVYLNWLAEPHAMVAINTNLDIDLTPYCSGFTNVSPIYSLSSVVNGTVTLLPDGHTARYTAPANFTGRASFNFKVAGSDGTAMTNTMGLVVTGVAPPQALTWRGDGIANLWNIATTTNWLNGTAPATFRTGDSVTFDDTGSYSPNINLATGLTTSGIEVNSTHDYTFSGPGTLVGLATLTKSGPGTLTIATTNNSYSGSVVVNGGTVALAGGSSLGSAALNLNSSGIFSLLSGNGTVFFGGSLLVSAGQSATIFSGQLGNGFSGSILSEDATSTLSLSNGVSFSGTSSAQFDGFTGTITIPSGSSLRFSANSSGNSYGSLNPAFVINGALQPRNAGNTIQLGHFSGTGTLTGPQSSSGTGDTLYVIGGNNTDANFSGTISSNTALAGSSVLVNKVGSGTLTLGGVSTYTGTTTVSAGTLLVNGTNGSSPAVVSSGATLGGIGLIGGPVTVNSSGVLAPGVSVGTLNLGGNLILNSAYLRFDLANNTTAGGGVNDLITLTGGNLSLSGTSTVMPNFLNGALANGTYTLITGGAATTGSTANLMWGGVAGTRQIFALDLATPGTALLQVSGAAPAALVWRGTNSSNWDLTATNWLNAGTPDKFFSLDTVLFDDTSTNGNVIVAATMLPSAVVVSNNTLPYTFSGTLGGQAVQKLGAGSLTLSSLNTYSGGTLVQGGDVFLANDTANQSGLGTGPVTLAGGTLNMFSGASTNTAAWNLIVPAATSGRLNADAVCDLSGSLTGGGVFNFFVPSTNTTLYGDWSAFGGQINVLTGTGGDFRLANLNGLPGATLYLSNNVSAYVALDPGTDTTIELGALSGSATAKLLGSPGDSILTWRIGAAGTDAAFLGNIAEQNTNTTTAIEKTGSGKWTLGGSNTYVGDTTVSAGTLRVNNTSGSGTGLGNLAIAPGATLAGTGIIGSDSTLANNATLAPGNSVGTLTFVSNLTLNDSTALQFGLGTNSDQVVVAGNLFLAGQLTITNSGGFGAGSYTLFTCAGTLSFGNLAVASAPAGYNYSFDTSTPGQVKLVVSLPAPPSFGSISLSGTNLIFSGSNGTPFVNYYMLAATNLTTPATNWIRIATNQFDANGGFSFTNGMDTRALQNYYRLQQ